MRFTYFLPGWMVLLGIGLVIGITLFVYLRLARPLPQPYRLLLIVLRVAAASILLACLLAPVIIEKRDITPPTHLSILVDTSRSMARVDASGNESSMSRLKQVNQLLFNEPRQFLGTLRDRFQVHLYPFNTGLQQNVLLTQEDTAPVPDFEADGPLTDIGTAVKEAAAAWKGQQSAGILLITDGAHNAGEFPLAQITALGVPVYPIGVGAVAPPKDIQIQHVQYTPIAYTGHESHIRVRIGQTGYTGKTTQLALREVESQTLIDTETFTFETEHQSTEQVIELKLTPQSEGNFQYTVTLPTLDGELTSENNQRTFSVKVVKAKLRVFYLEGRPRWDYTFLKRALQRDPDVEVTSAILSNKALKQQIPPESLLNRSGGYYPEIETASETPQFPKTFLELSKYDVLILGDLGAAHLTETQQRAIVDFVEQQGKSVIFLSSRRTLGVNGFRNTTLAHLLPIEIPRNGCRVADTEFTAQLTPAGTFHPMLQLDNFRSASVSPTAGLARESGSIWQNLPALSRSFNGFRLRAGATALMENNKGTPILVLQRSGLGKSLLLAAEGLWHWDFGVSSFKDTRYQAVYPRFWAQVLRWMSTDTDEKSIYLTTDAAAYTIGDTVRVTAYLYSATYQSQVGASVEMEVIPPEGAQFQQQMHTTLGDIASDTDNRYTAQFVLRQKGRYRIRATGSRGSLKLGADQIDIYAHPQLAELENIQLNEALLKQLAAQTGGVYFTLAEAESVHENIADVQNPVFVDAERELWSHPLVLITVVGLLGTEWFLRKRVGLT